MNRTFLVFCLKAALLSSTLLQAQGRDALFRLNSDFVSGAYFQSWSKSDDRVSQFSIPINYILPITSRLNFDITSGLAYAERTTAINGLDGLIDTRVRASYLTLSDNLLLTAYLTFPTGISRLKGDQNEVASALSDDALNFRTPNYGQGYRLNLGGAYAKKVSRYLILGGGAAFLLKKAFKPFAGNELEYQPGNEMVLTLGIDIGGKTLKLATDASYISYQADKSAGQDIFKSGNKLYINSRLLYNAQPFALTLYLQNRSKGKNEKGIGLLAEEALNSNGNQIDVGGIVSFLLGRSTTIKPLFGVKIYSKNEYLDRGALLYSVGSGLEHRFSRRISFDGILRFSKGELKSLNSSTGVTGIEIGGGIRYRL